MPVRVGVIGTSSWADLMHLPSLTSHPAARVVALCGRDRERAAALAARHGVPAVYDDYRAMLDREPLDAVVVALPDDLHRDASLRALDRGLHELCEKPLALSLAAARAMRDAAVRAGVVHMVFFTYRWVPAYRFIHDLVRAGRVGRPLGFALTFVNGYGLRPGYRWRDDARRSLGIVGDLGSHMVDLARWTLGDEARRARATLATFGAHDPPPARAVGDAGAPFAAAPDSAVVALEMAGGAHGTLACSAVARLGDQGSSKRLTVRGDRGTIEASITLAGADVLLAGDDGRPAERLAVPAAYGGDGDAYPRFREQPIGGRLFIDAILGRARPEPTFDDGVRVQAVIEAALASARSGRWETVETVETVETTPAG
jgi:predicted dehydrogenase